MLSKFGVILLVLHHFQLSSGSRKQNLKPAKSANLSAQPSSASHQQALHHAFDTLYSSYRSRCFSSYCWSPRLYCLPSRLHPLLSWPAMLPLVYMGRNIWSYCSCIHCCLQRWAWSMLSCMRYYRLVTDALNSRS